MNIGEAVQALQDGKRVTRPGWNGKGMYLWFAGGLANPDPVHRWQSFVVMHTAQGTEVPWLCSQTDLLADDWEIAP